MQLIFYDYFIFIIFLEISLQPFFIIKNDYFIFGGVSL